MSDQRVRPAVWLALAGSLLALAAAVYVGRDTDSAAPAATGTQAAATDADAATKASRSAPGPRLRKPGAASADAAAAQEPPAYIEDWVYGEVDLREVQLVMPDNLYWQLGSPTKDPAILEAREQEKARRNEEYGRVISGDATEAEVDAYYDYRERLSSDFLEFADYMKRRFGDKVDEKFQGLLDLSINLHTDKLASLPAERAEALERSRERARIREEWQREQAEFEEARRAAEAQAAAE